MIRILRLGNSDDTSPGIPDDQRAYALAAQVLEDAAGQPVETVVRTIWPDPELPGLIDEWLDRYKPDLVFLKVTWYWYGYESVPLRLERRLRWIGKRSPALARRQPARRASLATPRFAAPVAWLTASSVATLTSRPAK